MTKTTEDLKRNFYNKFEELKKAFQKTFGEQYNLGAIEDLLEAYLEALRQERVESLKYGNVLVDAYSHQQQLTIQARNEADNERNRRQAFEFANQSAGEFLQEARAKLKAQRQSIGQLKNERDNAVHALKVKTSKLEKALQELSELRKSLTATLTQSREEKSSSDAVHMISANPHAFIEANCKTGNHFMVMGTIPYCLACGFRGDLK